MGTTQVDLIVIRQIKITRGQPNHDPHQFFFFPFFGRMTHIKLHPRYPANLLHSKKAMNLIITFAQEI